MSRRNRGHAPLSLFAFQDIITSLSGVIIFMVLILTLELTQRPPKASPPTSTDVASRLDIVIEETRAEIESLRPHIKESAALLEQAAQSSPSQLAADIQEFQQQASTLEKEMRSLELNKSQLAEIEKQVKVQQFDQQDDKRHFDQLLKEIESLKRQLKRESTDNRFVYSLPRGFNMQGWLVVIDAHSVSVAPLQSRVVPIEFTDQPGRLLLTDTADQQFIRWAKEHDRESSYFFLVVRPAAISAFHKIEDSLKQRDYPYGFDLCGQQQVVLNPEYGAGE